MTAYLWRRMLKNADAYSQSFVTGHRMMPMPDSAKYMMPIWLLSLVTTLDDKDWRGFCWLAMLDGHWWWVRDDMIGFAALSGGYDTLAERVHVNAFWLLCCWKFLSARHRVKYDFTMHGQLACDGFFIACFIMLRMYALWRQRIRLMRPPAMKIYFLR